MHGAITAYLSDGPWAICSLEARSDRPLTEMARANTESTASLASTGNVPELSPARRPPHFPDRRGALDRSTRATTTHEHQLRGPLSDPVVALQAKWSGVASELWEAGDVTVRTAVSRSSNAPGRAGALGDWRRHGHDVTVTTAVSQSSNTPGLRR
jgi:hypothetical protein